jgi:hypothetical protein
VMTTKLKLCDCHAFYSPVGFWDPSLNHMSVTSIQKSINILNFCGGWQTYVCTLKCRNLDRFLATFWSEKTDYHVNSVMLQLEEYWDTCSSDECCPSQLSEYNIKSLSWGIKTNKHACELVILIFFDKRSSARIGVNQILAILVSWA